MKEEEGILTEDESFLRPPSLLTIVFLKKVKDKEGKQFIRMRV